MALGVEDDISGYYILANIKNNIFGQSEFLSFSMTTGINTKPSGELILIDRGGIGIDFDEGGKKILFEFNNVSDTNENKSSSLLCLIDSIEEQQNTGDNVSYKIKFSAGNPSTLGKKTFAYTGTSPDTMEAVYTAFNASSMNSLQLQPLNQSVKFADTMTWRCVAEDMWDQLNDIVSHSYRENDYLFWAWDDVNDSITVSTLDNSKKLPNQYILLHDDNHLGESEIVKLVKENPDYTVWYFGDFRRMGSIGEERQHLYPNTSFAVTDGTNQNVADIRNMCFTQTIRSMGDQNSQQLTESTDMGVGVSYGELEIVRHNPNNTHNMYSVAHIIRNYVRSTYSKKIKLVIYNNAGPAVGSKVTVICEPRDYRTGGEETIDYKYSDAYIVASKTITYTSMGVDTLGRPTPSTARQRTVLELISDNFAGDGKEHLSKIIEDFGW